MTRAEILAALAANELTSVAAASDETVVVGTHIVSEDGFFGEIIGKYVNPYPAPEETVDAILILLNYDSCDAVPTRKSELTTFFVVP